MKFPINYCVNIKEMCPEKFNLLLTKMKQDGYHWPSNCKDIWSDWVFVGVNSHSDIMLFNNYLHYQDYPEDPFWNVLNDKWVEEYLK